MIFGSRYTLCTRPIKILTAYQIQFRRITLVTLFNFRVKKSLVYTIFIALKALRRAMYTCVYL